MGKVERLRQKRNNLSRLDKSRADAMSQCKTAENELTDEAERKGLRMARFIIGELPSAEPSIVRCEECKSYLVMGDTTKYGWCKEHETAIDEWDFCSYGERRVGEKENDGFNTCNNNNNNANADNKPRGMSDLISRADAVDAVCNAQCELDVPHYPQCDQVKYCDEIKALLALPSADAVQCWISLSHDDDGLGTDFPYERDGEWVIVTDGKTISVERIKKDAYDHFLPNGRWFELEDVIAWMPLPKPYREEFGDAENESSYKEKV